MVGGAHTWDGTWAKRTVDWIRSQNKRLQRSGPSVCIHLPTAYALPAVCILLRGVRRALIWVIFRRVHTGLNLHAAAAKWKSPVSDVKTKGSALIYRDVRGEETQGPLGDHFENRIVDVFGERHIVIIWHRTIMPFFKESKGQSRVWSMHCRFSHVLRESQINCILDKAIKNSDQ